MQVNLSVIFEIHCIPQCTRSCLRTLGIFPDTKNSILDTFTRDRKENDTG